MNAYSKNTPTLTTKRLILRKFTPSDAAALLEILKDEETTAFLPMFSLKTLEEAETVLQEEYLQSYLLPSGYRYAICSKQTDQPIGFVNVGSGESRDLGYALKKEFWRQGLTTEAAAAVLDQLRRDGVPYVTATHDVRNPHSGGVMKKLGMRYCYSYEELWQPKNFKAVFRMYQLDLDETSARTYMGYWNRSEVRFVEKDV